MSAAAVVALVSGTYLIGELVVRARARFQQVSRQIDVAISGGQS